ncbi:MAG: hypothetical protein WC761_01795 [Candidatus Paceibacterota bacterium]|jgi:hypothetical protein
MPIYPPSPPLDGGPRLATSRTYSLASTSQSIFRIEGAPIVIWDMWQEVVVAVPGAALNWRLVFSPTTTQGIEEDMQPTWNTFFDSYAVGAKWYFRNTPGDGVALENIIQFSSAEPICRVMVPGTMHMVTTAPQASPPEFKYYMVWSPLSSSTDVVVL